jgi:hypothetical protein
VPLVGYCLFERLLDLQKMGRARFRRVCRDVLGHGRIQCPIAEKGESVEVKVKRYREMGATNVA